MREDDLRLLGEEGLTELLREWPSLLDHCPSLPRLASFISSGYAVSEALCHTNAFQHAVAEVLAALGPLHPHEVAVALDLEPEAPGVEAAISALERIFLAVRRTDGRVGGVSRLGEQFRYPLGLGRPLKVLATQLDTTTLRHAAGLLGLSKAGSKSALIDVVSRFLRDGDAVRKALSLAPLGTPQLVDHVLDTVVTDVGYGRSPPAAAWLLERLMLVRFGPHTIAAELPQEVALALRGPARLKVAPAPPTMHGHAVPDVEPSAVHHAGTAISLLGSLLDALDADPAKAIQSGELGVRDLRRLAKAADTDEATAGMLLEMGRASGLIGRLTTPVPFEPRRGKRWQAPPGPLVEWLPTQGYDTWLALAPGARWAALAGAWLESRAWPSRAGARTDTNKTTAAFTHHHDAAEAPWFRRRILELLQGLGHDHTAPVAELAAAVVWHRPRSAAWSSTDGATLTKGILAEADLLGVVANGALSPLGRALLEDREAATRLASAALAPLVREVMLQADLSAIAAGPVERSVTQELSAMADVEARGAATIWRFSEGSIRRALDQGTSAEHMLAFLDAHAAKGVPQPLRYLISDAARRHGQLRVAPVAAVITSDDPALLAEVRTARKTAKLRLRELAPSVLASPSDVGVVLSTLRAAGFLPAEEGPDGAVSVARTEPRRASGDEQAPREPIDIGSVARRLLEDQPAPARAAGDLLALAGLVGTPTDERSDEDVRDWLGSDEYEYFDDEELIAAAGTSAHDLLATAAERGTEVVVFSAEGRSGTEVVGTVVMLSSSTVVISDERGRKKPILLERILSVMECP
ncbi:MAG: hypothetical protein AVDCRST_MAG76-586 [uncultured Acidimicrobiales bacterium]|uniref:SAP domain-containing protein n=1 Tax=uncultured Acidimicrobiales bacterium TaxID=310071 RepID=A0A6J4HFY0_9ACTN|nr:MAG: hypothetical protein AVDCRST_MAG76-586 [uncultured Acidimicrobiales bacterium]